MLKKNHIPQKEPVIRVGIILPEDEQTSVYLTFPDKDTFKLTDSQNNSYNIHQNSKIKISVMKDRLNLTSDDITMQTSKLTFKPVSNQQPKPRNGILVEHVIAGRGFHWKKEIPVFLPHTLEISNFNGTLLLVNELPLESYLMCVATSEMNSSCPESLIESQTIVARSWLLANVEHKHDDIQCDVCNDDCCQRYQGTTHLSEQSITGAMNTFGQVLISDGKICDARYSKSCGGIMEEFQNVWQGKPLKYTQGIPDCPENEKNSIEILNSEMKVKKWIDSCPPCYCSPHFIKENELKQYLGEVDEEGAYYRWQFSYSQEEFTNLLNKHLNINAQSISSLEPLKRGTSGRIIEIKISYFKNDDNIDTIIVKDQYHIRKIFHKNFLYSSAFYVTYEGKKNIPDFFHFKGAGWGHGVGFCQIGALGMSLNGINTETIVYHYFPNSVLKKLY